MALSFRMGHRHLQTVHQQTSIGLQQFLRGCLRFCQFGICFRKKPTNCSIDLYILYKIVQVPSHSLASCKQCPWLADPRPELFVVVWPWKIGQRVVSNHQMILKTPCFPMFSRKSTVTPVPPLLHRRLTHATCCSSIHSSRSQKEKYEKSTISQRFTVVFSRLLQKKGVQSSAWGQTLPCTTKELWCNGLKDTSFMFSSGHHLQPTIAILNIFEHQNHEKTNMYMSKTRDWFKLFFQFPTASVDTQRRFTSESQPIPAKRFDALSSRQGVFPTNDLTWCIVMPVFFGSTRTANSVQDKCEWRSSCKSLFEVLDSTSKNPTPGLPWEKHTPSASGSINACRMALPVASNKYRLQSNGSFCQVSQDFCLPRNLLYLGSTQTLR